MRGMRQASNRAAKTAISFQCWVQESERGTSAIIIIVHILLLRRVSALSSCMKNPNYNTICSDRSAQVNDQFRLIMLCPVSIQ